MDKTKLAIGAAAGLAAMVGGCSAGLRQELNINMHFEDGFSQVDELYMQTSSERQDGDIGSTRYTFFARRDMGYVIEEVNVSRIDGTSVTYADGGHYGVWDGFVDRITFFEPYVELSRTGPANNYYLFLAADELLQQTRQRFSNPESEQ